MTALAKAIDRFRGVSNGAYRNALTLKENGLLRDVITPSQLSFIGDLRSQTEWRRGYENYHGWVHAAINALAQEGAGQPVNFFRLTGDSGGKGAKPSGTKQHVLNRMTNSMRIKAADQEWEIVTDDPFVPLLECPNPIQNRWQFVYNFIVNLNLTGWSFVVFGEGEDGQEEYYSLPTTWIKPIHKDGPFKEFKIINPDNPSQDLGAEPLTRDQVAFAHIPNPANPLQALAPSAAQYAAIRIDDHIQTSQETFFRNGIFPSAVVTVGKQPMPNNPNGLRPRLTAAQRNAIYSVIRKQMADVANYGRPAILDGLIESITRFSATSNEMGWDKSEDKVRTRILSAFCVHPYILGEAVSVGGHAQAAVIEHRFCKRVNTFLDMLSTLMTNIVKRRRGGVDNVMVWWEATRPNDEELKWRNLNAGRKNNDISQNEWRAEMNLPPDEDRNESIIGNQLTGVINLLDKVGQGLVTSDQAMGVLIGMGLPTSLAKRIAGQASEEGMLEEAVRGLKNAVKTLQITADVT